MLNHKILDAKLKNTIYTKEDIALIFAKLNSFAQAYHLEISYSFDLRPPNFVKDIQDNLGMFISHISPDNSCIEICNYLEFSELPQLHKLPFCFHLTRYCATIGAPQFHLLPGLPSTGALFEQDNSNIYNFVNRFGNTLRNISLHLGGCSEDWEWDTTTGAMKLKPGAVLLPREKAIAQCITSIKTLQTKLPAHQDKLILELLDYDYSDKKGHTAYEYFCEPEVITRIVRETNCGLLIDLAHIAITVCTLLGKTGSEEIYTEAVKYISTCCSGDYSRIKEVHFFLPGYDRQSHRMHHADAPIFREKHGQLAEASFVWAGTAEYKLATRLLQHIIIEHNLVSREKLIINFETSVKEMLEDISTFIFETAGQNFRYL